MLLLGRRHLEIALLGYVAHDNQHRPHRALGQAPPQGAVPPPAPAADVRVLRVDRLGGLIHEYNYVRSPDVDEFSAPTGSVTAIETTGSGLIAALEQTWADIRRRTPSCPRWSW